MTITYRYFQGEQDIALQYSFWIKATSTLPYAWKPTKSPIHFKNQQEFHPKSRCFAFNGEDLVGYMSFTGKGDFVSLGYPWVQNGYENIQDELFRRVYDFSTSEEYGGKILAQRFRSQWENQILYFESKGFEITNESEILGREVKNDFHLSKMDYETNRCSDFPFNEWKEIMERNEEATQAQLDMMEEYYSSVDFSFAMAFSIEEQTIGIMGVTIREDTKYSEVLALGILQDYNIYKESMLKQVIKEVEARGGKVIGFHGSDITEIEIQKELGLGEITKDVMMVKEL
ncbi:hypothetical protein [Rossellomorea aquimaris]|uniref:hypothetical protein n=1 Tax=Rossellomorea aquimaris TaxID=189382 RepID=UPI0007D09EE9|nr:hypothetical protein [Rossellomorea aquimaris]